MKKQKFNRLYCLILLIATFPILTVAVVNRSIRFSHLTNNEGLPGNSVYTICQDHKGFIWIGTKSGLCKYDGRSVSAYDQETVEGKRLESGQIRKVFEDSQQRLWVVAQKGVNLYDREKDLFNLVETDPSFDLWNAICQDNQGTVYLAGSGVQVYNEEKKRFETLYTQEKEGFPGSITALTAGRDGRLWIGKGFDGLLCATPSTGKIIHYRYDLSDNHSLSSDRIVSLYTDKKGNIWVGTIDNGVCYFDGETGQFLKVKGFPAICVRAFAEDQEGNIWIGSEDGLYIYSPQSRLFTHHKQNYNDRYSLNDNAIYTIFRDREDNVLIGTYFGGINIFSNSYRQFFHYDYGYTEKHLSGKAVRQIIGDKKGNLWISTEDGGLNYYDPAKGVFEHFKPEPGKNSLSYHNVHTVLLDSSGNLWVGTFLGGLNRYNPATKTFTHYSQKDYPGLIVDNIFTLLEDRDRKIWIGTTRGVSVYDPVTGQFHEFEKDIISPSSIDYLYEDSGGNIWMATRNRGVYCYNKPEGTLRNYAYSPDGKGLPDNYVNSVFEDSDRNIWIGTHEGGLCKYNRQSEVFTVLTVKDGLPSNTIFSIIEGNDGNLWISTNNGLSCLDINNYTFTNYSVSEGLPDKQFNYNSACKAPDGLLYFGTINGMIAFNPDELQTIRNVAQVEFASFRIFGKIIRPGDEDSPLDKSIEEVEVIRLNSEQAKSFTLDFTVPTLSHPNSTFFALKFNRDPDWSYLGLQNQVTYANLPPGEYMLNVKAAFNNRWTGTEPVKSLKIIIAPPFWKSTTARFIYFGSLLLIVSLIYLFLKRRQQEKRIILAERLEKEKMKEINALKLNFFTNISHELRTPLSLILTPIQSYLDRNIFKPEVKPKMKLVADNARRMNNLLDELILFSKIETRQEKIRVKKGDLLSFIEMISEGFQVLADEKSLAFHVDIPSVREEVWFAPVKVEKIIYNLLSNAFKYTDDGTITIKAGYESVHSHTFLHLVVSDTGVGIAPAQKDRIFENYYQVNDFVNGQKTGFGIGLALVRELVSLHKGSISVDSELGKGSLFTVRINVSAEAFAPDEVSDKDADTRFIADYKFLHIETEAPDFNPDITPEEKILHQQYKLLIIEDNRELLSVYGELFSDTYTLLMAGDGPSGLRMAREHQPDLIISDVMMPGMSGFELAAILKSEMETCHIPLVLLTARTGEEAQLEGYESGADLYIEKPFHPALIRRQISNLISTRENQRKRYKANEIEIIEIDANEKDKKLISTVEQVIIKHLDDSTYSLNDLLREVGVGRTLLHVKLKNLVGLSTTEFINKIRLNESIKLLAKGKNISEVAYATGFSSPNYYSRCFKRYYGMAPNEYLKKKI